MEIFSEKDVYKFLQLVNDEYHGDLGAKLFIKHLFAIGKLRYVKALYKEEIEPKTNEDIIYYAALETKLEKFASEFDSFINEDKPVADFQQGDIEQTAKKLVEEMMNISSINLTKNIETDFTSICLSTDIAINYIKILRANRYFSGIVTEISSTEYFLLHRKSVNYYDMAGLYFLFKNNKN